jgi:hypothetical protein
VEAHCAALPDSPRLLHRRSQHGYTDRLDLALSHEPEAISADDQAFLTARAHRAERQVQLREWEERRAAIAREIDWLHSQRFERDVSKTLRVLRRQLDRVDKQITGR